MRKTALLVTTLFAIASSSAFALGDRNKEKKAADGATTSSPSTAAPSGTTSSTYTAPSSTASSSSMSSADATPKTQVAQNDPRCDESKYTSKEAMPKECFDKTSTGASAVSSTQGQSGGANSPSGAASSSPSSSSASSGGTGTK